MPSLELCFTGPRLMIIEHITDVVVCTQMNVRTCLCLHALTHMLLKLPDCVHACLIVSIDLYDAQPLWSQVFAFLYPVHLLAFIGDVVRRSATCFRKCDFKTFPDARLPLM